MSAHEPAPRGDDEPAAGHHPTRRELLGALAAVPFGAALGLAPEQVRRAALAVQAARTEAAGPAAPKVFSAHEWETVKVLVDLIIPRDGRSGSATDAGVPEFMDFILAENAEMVTPVRGGLAWLDGECRRRHERDFATASDAQRRGILDDIAWPARAKPGLEQGVAFFTRMRDFTASGFWSSRMGWEDLGYQGNTPLAEWPGCPPAATERLGVKYP